MVAPLEQAMPTTLTLKNIPDEIYTRLKDLAAAHRRSLNSEAINCLESVLVHNKISPAERLERARDLRSGLPKTAFRSAELDKLKRLGRA
jgi:antitoxin FitA